MSKIYRQIKVIDLMAGKHLDFVGEDFKLLSEYEDEKFEGCFAGMCELDYGGISITISCATLDSCFILVEKYDEYLTYGSEIKLNIKGVLKTYKICNILSANSTYASLDLKSVD